MLGIAMLFGALAAPAPEAAEPDGSAALALLLLIAMVAGWIGLRSLVRRLRARKADKTLRGDFVEYALQALVNAAKLDGRVNDMEKRAIVTALRDLDGEAFESARVEAAFASARLTKNELVDYLSAKAQVFTRDEKASFLKALLSVFVSDGRFDATEHAALVDYTEAIGFDRQSAIETLRRLSGDFVRGNVT